MTSSLASLRIPPTLAVELVAGLSTPTEIFKRHDIPKERVAVLLKSPVLKSMIREAKTEWDGDHNAETRIRAKARMALEELLIPQFTMASDSGTPATARNEAVKLFKSLSGLDREEAASGEGFTVNISLGSGAREEKIVLGSVED